MGKTLPIRSPQSPFLLFSLTSVPLEWEEGLLLRVAQSRGKKVQGEGPTSTAEVISSGFLMSFLWES